MNNVFEQIATVLNNVKGDSNFVSTGTVSFIIPGLIIDGVGEVGFPLQKEMAEKIIQHAHSAPFGKGAETLVDTTVRNTWEVNREQVKFSNKKWDTTLKEIVDEVKEELSLEDEEITASFYKLLLYEKGSFFKPHKDSEKEKGMFATLVISLPSDYEGGEFVIEFDNQKKVIEKDSNKFDIQYTAFYADCSHELLEVKSGYRISLVYNLIRFCKDSDLGPKATGNHINLLAPLFKQALRITGSKPLAYILEHQYTPENFSLQLLKRNDNLKVQVIIQSARQAGMYVNVGLLTHYLMGDIEDDGGYDYGYNSREVDAEDCVITEVHEESTELEYWILDNVPKIGTVSKGEIDIINEKKYDDDEPIQKEAEGYMGNYGMTAEYWYHYGAVIFGSNEAILQTLQQSENSIKLEWIQYFLTVETQNINRAKELLFSLDATTSDAKSNYTVITPLVLQLNDSEIDKVIPVLIHYTDLFENEGLLKIINYLKGNKLAVVIEGGLQLNKLSILLKWLQIINDIETNNLQVKVKLSPCYQPVFATLGLLFKKQDYYGKDDNETKIAIIRTIILLDTKVDTQHLIRQLFASRLTRDFLYKVLHPALLQTYIKTNSTWQQLLLIAINKLETDTKQQPEAPTDWTRDFPNVAVNTDKLKLLKDFLLNAGQQQIIYARAERERSEVTSLIDSYHLDISCAVIKKGSPHQLVLTKNENSYLQKLKVFKEDVDLKEKLNGLK